MQSLASSFTADHLKLLLTFLFALLSLYKIGEIRQQKTNIKNAYQIDVGKKDKQSQSGLKGNNIQGVLRDINLQKNNHIQVGHKQNIFGNSWHSIVPKNTQMYKQDSANNRQMNMKESYMGKVKEETTLGEYLKKKHEEAIFNVRNDPLIIYARQCEQNIKNQHYMEVQEPEFNPNVQSGVKILNQQINFYETPKAQRTINLQAEFSEKTQQSSSKVSKPNKYVNRIKILSNQKVQDEQLVYLANKTANKDEKLINNKIKRHAFINCSHQNLNHSANYRRIKLQRLSRNLHNKKTDKKREE